MTADLIYIPFLFALGACIGSFLNVVVWRLPRDESLVTPPSHCPKCDTPLAWYDNIPVFGWIMLRGRCRYCQKPISPRYPIIEAITGLLFVMYYWVFFITGLWRVPVRPDLVWHALPVFAPALFVQQWPMYMLYMFTISSLLAASLIDAELFIIPLEIPWLMAVVGIVFHTFLDRPHMPGSLDAIGAAPVALAAGAAIGLIITLTLFRFACIPQSFPQGEPLLEVEREELLKEIARLKKERVPDNEIPPVPPPYTRKEIRAEMGKEMLFLLPPMLLGALAVWLTMPQQPLHDFWLRAVTQHLWLRGLLGSLLGALVGAMIVCIFRIFGTLAFGRIAMGMGDVHLMFGVGAVLGAGGATVAFFLAPFFGIATALYMFIVGKRREIPYGPYLSLATAATMLFYNDIVAWFAPGFAAIAWSLGI